MVQLVVSVPSNPLMAMDCYRNGLVIWCNNAFGEVRIQTWTHEFGITTPPDTGIFVWEGDLEDPTAGTWRVPSDAEWDLMKQNLNPFN